MSRNVHPQQLLQQQQYQHQQLPQPQQPQQQQQPPYTYYTATEYYSNMDQLQQDGDYSTDYVSDSDGFFSDHQQQYIQHGDVYNTTQATSGYNIKKPKSGPDVVQAADTRRYNRQPAAKPPKRPHTLIAVAAENYPQYYDVAGILPSQQQYHSASTCPLSSMSQQMSSVAQQLASSGQQPMITISQPESAYRDYGDIPVVQQHQPPMRQDQQYQNKVGKQTTGTTKKYPITVGTPK
ncbi:unnamed protein product [Callosobruchus maculatus]|uniref:Uncharacterized protein n=1 Tax=Callosobruchus maculatus TaxID=64391 RepID=A0A653CR37_CALMS|nr:unnamed protein product [Callosobruchus maculatus]